MESSDPREKSVDKREREEREEKRRERRERESKMTSSVLHTKTSFPQHTL